MASWPSCTHSRILSSLTWFGGWRVCSWSQKSRLHSVFWLQLPLVSLLFTWCAEAKNHKEKEKRTPQFKKHHARISPLYFPNLCHSRRKIGVHKQPISRSVVMSDFDLLIEDSLFTATCIRFSYLAKEL